MSSCDDLERAIQFLKTYQWIYSSRNTEILTGGTLSNFPQVWKDYFNTISVGELHDLVKGAFQDCAPEDLKSFIEDANRLAPNIRGETNITESKRAGLTKKKGHEIELLAPIIHETCQERGCDLIIDIGCGVGHLPYFLSNKYGYSVLALEASFELVATALKGQSKSKVIFERMFVQASSAPQIALLSEKHFGAGRKVCLTGLHACADLSVDALRLFHDFPEAVALVIMPCCYHRMQRSENFPSSKKGRDLFEKFGAQGFLGGPFLRLACQQTKGAFLGMSELEHRIRGRQCMFRAVLELAAQSENCTVRRLKRKSGKSVAPDGEGGFQDYLNNLGKTHELAGEGIRVTDEIFQSKMHEKWTENKNECWLVEVLMGLQAAIQAVCENFVLLDRIEFLKEKGLHCCRRKITNDSISPRCWALIARKPSL